MIFQDQIWVYGTHWIFISHWEFGRSKSAKPIMYPLEIYRSHEDEPFVDDLSIKHGQC